jgi:hypothetical protein
MAKFRMRMRVAERNYDHSKQAEKLVEAITKLSPDNRRIMFEAEDSILQEYHPQVDPFNA